MKLKIGTLLRQDKHIYMVMGIEIRETPFVEQGHDDIIVMLECALNETHRARRWFVAEHMELLQQPV